MTKGVVAVTASAYAVVTNIYDISPGGVSFLFENDSDVTACELKMDIVIYDAQTDFDYCIFHLNGLVRSKELVLAPKSNKPIWRIGVEFTDIDCLQQSLLDTFCGLERTIGVCVPSQPLSKSANES